jgi:hypothetical protein
MKRPGPVGLSRSGQCPHVSLSLSSTDSMPPSSRMGKLHGWAAPASGSAPALGYLCTPPRPLDFRREHGDSVERGASPAHAGVQAGVAGHKTAVVVECECDLARLGWVGGGQLGG